VESDEESRLLAAARAGDERALEALLVEQQPRLYRFSRKMCRNVADAQDVLQDTLLAMARGLRDFRGASSLSTWLYTIARSHCIKKRRRSKFAPEAEVSLASEEARQASRLADPGRSPQEQLSDRRLGDALEAAIHGLDPALREVLVLRDVEGLTAPEVAQVTGLSVDAVKSRLHRARVAVREDLVPLVGPTPAPPSAVPAGCPDVVKLFSRHLEGEIDPDACAEMERHVASCRRCRAACESLRETLRVCRSSAPPDVPEDLKQSIRQGIRAVLSGGR
jgi:RNA polymerase sigma-70 factor, ECF subfamily